MIKLPVLIVVLSLIFSITTYATNNTLPIRSQRVYAIEKADLVKELKNSDEMEQDLLYVRAQSLSPEQLKKHYPQLPSEKLLKLQKIVRGK